MSLKLSRLPGPMPLAAILALGVSAAWVVACGLVYVVSQPWLPDVVHGETATASSLSLVYPAIPLFGFVYFLNAPAFSAKNRVDTDFITELYSSLPHFLPALLAIGVVSAALATWCYKRHRRYSEHGAAAWAGFVFVMGPPGLIGYLLHRHWPMIERCQNCGKDSPRDRDACLHCGTEFPTPAMKGIEIFA